MYTSVEIIGIPPFLIGKGIPWVPGWYTFHSRFWAIIALPLTKAEALFAGKRFVLKKEMTPEQGKSAMATLRSIGAQAQLVKIEMQNDG